MKPDYYLHPAFLPSRTAVIDVGLKCATASCPFCFYLHLNGEEDPSYGMRHAKFHTWEHIKNLIDSIVENKFILADITGGDPGLHPNIIDLVGRCTDNGLATRIITLGTYMQRPMHGRKGKLIDELLAAGLTDFRLSVHEIDEENFRKLLNASWEVQLANMNQLDNLGFQYMTNTTINTNNYKRLPLIAKEITKHNVYNATILFMMAHYQWAKDGNASDIQTRYTESANYCREAVAILEDAKIATIVRYAPLCTIAGLEKNHVGALGVRYDPHEWMNAMDHKADPLKMTPEISKRMGSMLHLVPGQASDGLELVNGDGMCGTHKIIGGRGNPNGLVKAFAESCRGCSAMPVCDGIEPQYLERHGPSEFTPYVEDNRGHIIDRERLAYRPAYFVKLKQYADVKKAIARTFAPEPISYPPLVSVVITCYNKGKYVKETLDSVALQNYPNIELVFVDDCSTDDSLEVYRAHSLSKGATTIEKTENTKLPAICRNLGIQASTGELIVCLDADDILEKTYIAECVDTFFKNPQASIVYSALKCFGDSDAQWGAPAYDYTRLIQQNFICCASMFRRKAWEEAGGYIEDIRIRGIEDWGFWVTLGSYGHTGVPIHRSLWKYRVSNDGIFNQDVQPNFKAKCNALADIKPHLYDWLVKQGWQQ